MKRILLLGTGGTIACKRTDKGLKPVITSDEILSYVPDSRSYCEIHSIQLMNIDSTNIQPCHWLAVEKGNRGKLRPIRRLCHHPRHGHHGLYGRGPVLPDSAFAKAHHHHRGPEAY
ncbi:MAG: asparaginase domain-containing protein [Enterocloster clostridioformis]